MVEDVKAARDRRLAEALRANLKRRKAAKTARTTAEIRAQADGTAEAETPVGLPHPAEGDS